MSVIEFSWNFSALHSPRAPRPTKDCLFILYSDLFYCFYTVRRRTSGETGEEEAEREIYGGKK